MGLGQSKILALSLSALSACKSVQVNNAALASGRVEEPLAAIGCEGADAGTLIGSITETIGTGGAISTLVPRLFSEGVTLDALQSGSAQASQHAADPRLLIRVGCVFHTFTLLGGSLELGIAGQKADVRLPGSGQSNPSSLTPESVASLTGELEPTSTGEILVDFHDVANGVQSAAQSVSHYDPNRRHSDSNGCSSCHNRVGAPARQLGQKLVSTGKETFLALVNVFGREGDGGYCIPEDLEFIQACKCKAASTASAPCKMIEADELSPEACARLEAVLALKPTQLGYVGPEKTEGSGERVCLSRQPTND